MACSKSDDSQSGGTVTYTINGKTYTSDNFSGLLIDGKYAGGTNAKDGELGFDVKIGDSEDIELKNGNVQPIVCVVFPDGVFYGRNRSNNGVKLTIVSWDGTTLKATFEGKIYLDGDYLTPGIDISGSFETNVFSRI